MSRDEWTGLWALVMVHPRALDRYPSDEEQELACEVYYAVLQDIDRPTASAAIYACLARSPHFPAPADIRDAAGLLRSQTVKTGLEAWGEVLDAVRVRGSVSDPLANRILAGLGGLRSIGQTEYTKLDTARAHFTKAYDAHCAHERQLAQIPEHVRQLALGPASAEGDDEETTTEGDYEAEDISA